MIDVAFYYARHAYGGKATGKESFLAVALALDEGRMSRTIVDTHAGALCLFEIGANGGPQLWIAILKEGSHKGRVDTSGERGIFVVVDGCHVGNISPPETCGARVCEDITGKEAQRGAPSVKRAEVSARPVGVAEEANMRSLWQGSSPVALFVGRGDGQGRNVRRVDASVFRGWGQHLHKTGAYAKMARHTRGCSILIGSRGLRKTSLGPVDVATI